MNKLRITAILCSLLAASALSLGARIASAGPFAYVPNVLPASVSVIDTATNEISATVAFPSMSNPFAAALTPDLKKVYVSGQNGSVFVLDTTTNAIGASPIAVGSLTAGIAITPDGKHVYVASQYTSTVSVIDTDTDTVSATIPFPSGSTLQNIAITPDGRRAYVTAQAASAVFAIDTSTNTMLGTAIDVGSSPFGIAVSPDGKDVYVTHSDSTAFVSVIDPTSNTVAATIASSPYLFGVTFTPDGKSAYVTGGGGVGYTSVIDTATRALVAAIPQGGNAVAITADGKQAYLPAASSMSVIDTATNVLISTINGLSLAQNVSARPLPPGVVVPDVVGDTQATAMSAIVAAGLTTGAVTQQASGSVAPGSVISEVPAAGVFVGANAAVSLVLSTGVAVPNVTGQTQAAASGAITAAGLVVGTVTQQSSNLVASGSVISQSPTAGANVAAGSAVNLVVSTGNAGGGGGGSADPSLLVALVMFLLARMRRLRGISGQNLRRQSR
jgi:YVTN family beta-propeller protein